MNARTVRCVIGFSDQIMNTICKLLSFRTLHASISLLAIFIALDVHAKSAEEEALSENECSVINLFDQKYGLGAFVDRFLHMAHTQEICESEPCLQRLSKWSGDITIKGTLLKRTRVDNIGIYSINTEYFRGFFRHHTDLDVTISNELSGHRNIEIVLFKRSEIDDLYRVFDRQRSIIDLIDRHDLPCAALIYSDKSDGSIGYSIAFIDIGLEKRNFARCVKEEIFNSVGFQNDPVGLGSIFDDTFLRDDVGPYIYDRYSKVEEVMISIMYRPEFVSGMEIADTRQRLQSLISTSCKGHP